MNEDAKAVQEVAKTAGKAIDTTRELGGFVSRIIGEPLESAVGMIGDKLSYMRWERQTRLMMRSEEVINELGLEGRMQPVQMKLAVRILQGASMEEDDVLQDIWIKLLVNAANPDFKHEIIPAFATILNDFGPMEARILQTIYEADIWPMRGAPINGLPDSVREEYSNEPNVEPSQEVKVAVWNLVRLNCLKHCEVYSNVAITDLGKALIRACTLPGDEKTGPNAEAQGPILGN